MDGIQIITQKLMGKSANGTAPVDDGGVAALFQALLNKQDQNGQGAFDPVAQLESSSGLLAQDDTADHAPKETDLNAEAKKDDAPADDKDDDVKADDAADDDRDESKDQKADGDENKSDKPDDADKQASKDDGKDNAAAAADGAGEAAVGAAQAHVLKNITEQGPKVAEATAAAVAKGTETQANTQQNGQNAQNAAAVAAAAKAGQDAQAQARQAFQNAAAQTTATTADTGEKTVQTQTAQNAVKAQTNTQQNAQTVNTAAQQQNAAAQRQANDLAGKVNDDARLQVQVKVTEDASKQTNKNAGLLASASRIALEGSENVRNQIAASSFNMWNTYRGPQGQGQAIANGGNGTGQAAQPAGVQPQPITPVEQSSNQALTTTPSPSAPLSQSPTAQQGDRFGVDPLERPAALKSSASSAASSSSTASSNTSNGASTSATASQASQASTQTSAPQPTPTASSNPAPQSQFAQQVGASTQGAERTQTQGTQVVDQIRVAVTKGAKQGMDRITVQLKPADLGRVEVKLEMGSENQVRVQVVADNKDTLDLMQRDSRGLEKALQDAGLRTGSSDIEFSLREQDDQKTAGKEAGDGGTKNGDGSDEDAAANENAALLDDDLYDYEAAAEARGGVDTRV